LLIDKTESADSPVPPDTLKCRKYFWVFLGVVLISRLIIWTLIPEHPQSFLEVDSPSYTDPAEALIADGRYDTKPGSGTPETLRPPGYPVWLSLIFLLFGKSTQAVVFSHIFLFLGTLALTFALTEKMFGPRSAWVAVILLALDPSSLSYTFKILTETLTAFLTLAFAYCVFGFYRTRGKFHFGLGAGLSLALVTLVRPTTYYFMPILLFALMIFLIREKFKWKAILSGLLITLLPFLVLVGGWQWRNLETAGVFRLTSVQGWALYLGKGAQIYSEKYQVPLKEAQSLLLQKLDQTHPHWSRLPMEQLDDIYLAEGWKLVQENPGLAVKTHILHTFYFFCAPGTTSAFFRIFDPDFEIIKFNWFQKGEYFREIFNSHRPFLLWMLMGTAYLGILYVWLAVWIVQRWRSPKELMWKGCHVLFLLLILYIAGASSVNYGQDRYRVVVMPLLCIYAGAGFPGFLNYLKALNPWKKKAA
jgi:4-amino-4-deoxy-L-arabinose transferase-like glycosyltransferase